MSLAATRAHSFPTSRLHYTRGKDVDQCPDASAIRAEVERRLGYDPFLSTAEKIIDVSVERASDKLQGRVELIDGSGNVRGLRMVSTDVDRCEELIGTLALTISIAIDPASAAGRVLPEAASAFEGSSPAAASLAPGLSSSAAAAADGSISSTPRPATPNDEAPEVTAAEPAKAGDARSIRWTAGAGVFASYQIKPGLAVGPHGMLSGRVGNLSLSLDLGGDLPSRDDSAGFQSSTLTLNVVPCLHREPLFGCLVSASGIIFAKDDSRGWGLFWLAGARFGGEMPLGKQVGLQLYLDTLFPLVITTVESRSGKWKAPYLSASLGTALVWHFR